MGREDDLQIDEPTGDERTIYEKVMFRVKKPTMSRSKALQARPIRNPALKWEALDTGEVRVILPRRRDIVGKLLTVLFYVPESRPVNLDMVGGKVWGMSDGTNTVDDIAAALEEEHRLHRREAEVSLTEFLKMLGKRNMVAFAVPTDYLDEHKKKPDAVEADGDEPDVESKRGGKANGKSKGKQRGKKGKRK